jgi:hypothetical protein
LRGEKPCHQLEIVKPKADTWIKAATADWLSKRDTPLEESLEETATRMDYRRVYMQN